MRVPSWLVPSDHNQSELPKFLDHTRTTVPLITSFGLLASTDPGPPRIFSAAAVYAVEHFISTLALILRNSAYSLFISQ